MRLNHRTTSLSPSKKITNLMDSHTMELYPLYHYHHKLTSKSHHSKYSLLWMILMWILNHYFIHAIHLYLTYDSPSPLPNKLLTIIDMLYLYFIVNRFLFTLNWFKRIWRINFHTYRCKILYNCRRIKVHFSWYEILYWWNQSTYIITYQMRSNIYAIYWGLLIKWLKIMFSSCT